jgi:hypothetical protein
LLSTWLWHPWTSLYRLPLPSLDIPVVSINSNVKWLVFWNKNAHQKRCLTKIGMGVNEIMVCRGRGTSNKSHPVKSGTRQSREPGEMQPSVRSTYR